VTASEPSSNAGTFRLIVLVIGALVLADLAGATVVSLIEGRPPQVLGDVAKVGIGALAGAAVALARSR
jgi:hypothetical protein